MTAPHDRAALTGKDVGAGRGPTGFLATRRAERCDTLIASAVLALLLAGWVMNFVSLKDFPSALGGLIAHAYARQA